MGIWTPGPAGTEGNDKFVGNASDETALGLGGDDFLSGGGGNDFLDGGEGNDTIDGGSGNDILIGGGGTDIINGGTGNDTFRPNTVSSGLDNSQYDGGDGIDTLDYSVAASFLSFQFNQATGLVTVADIDFKNIEVIIGGSGNDIFFGNLPASIEIFGGAGNDLISRRSGNAVAHGGEGDDDIDVDPGNRVFGDGGNDRFFASGTFGGDVVYGTVDGGSGDDTLRTNILFRIDLAVGTATAGTATYTISGVENIIGFGQSGEYSTHAFGDGEDNTFSVNTLFDDDSGQVFYDGRGGNDTLSGSLGADTLIGGAGDDHLSGRGGDDRLEGGVGADILDGSSGNDTYVEIEAIDTIIEMANGGSDTIEISRSFTLIDRPLIENIRLIGTAAVNATGNAANNRLTGNDAANILNGLAGADVMEGGRGNDRYYVDMSGDQVVEAVEGGTDTVLTVVSYTLAKGQEIEILRGSDAAATSAINLTGNEYANSLIGNAGVNRLTGGDGNDVLNGLAGNDIAIGGLGNDTTYVDAAGDRVIEAVGEGTDTVYAAVSYILAVGQEIEILRANTAVAIDLTGNATANTLIGNAAVNVLDGGGGVDVMSGLGGNDVYYVNVAGDQVREAAGGGTDTIYASAGYGLGAGQEIEKLVANTTAAISLTGNAFANTLVGNAAANTLNGGAGVDVLQGLAGNDIYYVDAAGDQVQEATGGGTDTVYAAVSYALGAGQEIETLRANTGVAISLTGNAFANTLIGNDAVNTLNGGTGIDIMTGLGGNDVYYVDAAGDQVREAAGGGADTVYASVSYALASGQEIETLRANTTAAINLTGNTGANTLIGNAAANTLNGGAGIDVMTGLGGNDIYYVDAAGDQVREAAGGGADTVYASVSYALASGQEIETLRANTIAAINLTGNAIANTIIGNAAANVLQGGGGADTLTPGTDTAIDTVRFVAVADSTGLTRDTVIGFDFNEDKLDFTIVPVGTIGVVKTGALNDGATFNSDIATAINDVLGVGGAAIFTPDAGGLAGSGSYLVVDANRDGLYVSGVDHLVQMQRHTGTLDLTDFV